VPSVRGLTVDRTDQKEAHSEVSKKNGKNTDAALAQQLIAGTNKHLANLATLMFGSATFTPAQIATSLQRLATLRADVTAAQATTKAKLAAEAAEAPALRSLMIAFGSFVKVTFSQSPDVLADFGLHPKKAPAPLTVVKKAAAAAKRKATREARHTMGARQKKAVKGTVTGVVVTPISVAQPVVTASNGTNDPPTVASAGAAPRIP
jgi:hypothetical protein